MDLDRGYYALWALFVYGVFLLYLLAPVPGKRPVVPVCACVVTLCLSALLTAKTVQRQDLALTVLDVGQGQSVVVTSGHARALIDCGGTRDPGDTAATYLQSLGRSELDLLILTHFHADHAGVVLSFKRSFRNFVNELGFITSSSGAMSKKIFKRHIVFRTFNHINI